jgi:hypothetical protein
MQNALIYPEHVGDHGRYGDFKAKTTI